MNKPMDFLLVLVISYDTCSCLARLNIDLGSIDNSSVVASFD